MKNKTKEISELIIKHQKVLEANKNTPNYKWFERQMDVILTNKLSKLNVRPV